MSIRNQYTDLFDGGYYNDIAKFKDSQFGVTPCGSRSQNNDFDLKEHDVKSPKLHIENCFKGNSQSKLIRK